VDVCAGRCQIPAVPQNESTATAERPSARVGIEANADLDRSIRSKTVAIRSMTLGVPVTDAAPYLITKVGAALIRQVPEVANEVCDGVFVARAADLAQSGA
jgi:hypothetical protein